MSAVAVLVLAGCSHAGTPGSTSPASSSTRGAAAAGGSPASTPLDIAALPLGAAPEVTYLGGGQLHWRGRTVPTDFPADALYVHLLGVAGGRLVATAYQDGGSEPTTRFWTLDRSGRAERLGTGYDSRDNPPRLVPSTGHLWVYTADRTTPWTIWEVDARTGRELATYHQSRAPRGLAPADQAVVDAWLTGGTEPAPLTDRTRDGSREASVRLRLDGSGVTTAVLTVRSTSDGATLARIALDLGTQGSVDDVVLESRDDVLVLVTASASRRRGPAQVVVRCAVTTRTCERATEIGGAIALGVPSTGAPS